ncbi:MULTISPECIES: hypothetical protein [Nonomuraea]|uniref:WD40 repeat domain-containing protein n=1 Tax=Nonomuraea mangrovi TaxID=2316207 RepID=A0ABW4TDF2_9ACTN
MDGKLTVALVLALSLVAAPAQAEQGSRIRLAGTSATLDDVKGPSRLASYILTEDAGNANIGYLRVGDGFVRTPYRQVPVSKNGRWAVGVPGHQRYKPARRIVLIDRARDQRYTVAMPVGVTSAQWSPDGRTVLLTAYRSRGESYETIGFVTVDVHERRPRLVPAGSTWFVEGWDVGLSGRFFWNGEGTGVLSTLEDGAGVAAFDLSGRRTRVYAGAGSLETLATSVFAPSGGRFVSLGDGDTSDTREIRVVDAVSGRIVHRLRGSFQGWYGDDHIIVMRGHEAETAGPPTSTFRLVSPGGRAGTVLIRERLRYTEPVAAGYKPHLAWVDFPG